MRNKFLCLFFAIAAPLSAQAPSAPPAFSHDEIAIYRDFLLHYGNQLSNIIGMQDTTVAFVSPTGFRQQPAPLNLKIPTFSGRKLPSEVMALTDEKVVTARIAAKGELIDPSRRRPQTGPDGFALTHFTLSEIAFDPKHRQAAFIYSADCGCRGGQGGMVIYERKHGRWKWKTTLNAWEG
jgi:hypothetical protein